jgi:hypothetical protein
MYVFEEQSHYYLDTLTREFGWKYEYGHYIIDFSEDEEDLQIKNDIENY